MVVMTMMIMKLLMMIFIMSVFTVFDVNPSFRIVSYCLGKSKSGAKPHSGYFDFIINNRARETKVVQECYKERQKGDERVRCTPIYSCAHPHIRTKTHIFARKPTNSRAHPHIRAHTHPFARAPTYSRAHPVSIYIQTVPIHCTPCYGCVKMNVIGPVIYCESHFI